MEYTPENLKDLSDYLRAAAKEALKQEPPNHDNYQTFMDVVRQLEAIRYNPILFESILDAYEVDYSVMEATLDDVPLHINDSGILSVTIVKWRCTNGI